MQLLPNDMQNDIISATWNGLRFGFTCKKYADLVKRNAHRLAIMFGRTVTIDLKRGDFLIANVLPNGVYYGHTELKSKGGSIKCSYIYENNKIVKYKKVYARDWKHVRHIGNVKYKCSRRDADLSPDILADIERYDKDPTDIDDNIPVRMATLGRETRLEAIYNYEIGHIMIEIEWGELKVNVRAKVECAIGYDLEENKTRCRVYKYPPHNKFAKYIDNIKYLEPWINNQPNWGLLQMVADDCCRKFVRDEALWRLKWSGFNEDIEIIKVRAAEDVKLPPGFGSWLF